MLFLPEAFYLVFSQTSPGATLWPAALNPLGRRAGPSAPHKLLLLLLWLLCISQLQNGRSKAAVPEKRDTSDGGGASPPRKQSRPAELPFWKARVGPGSSMGRHVKGLAGEALRAERAAGRKQRAALQEPSRPRPAASRTAAGTGQQRAGGRRAVGLGSGLPRAGRPERTCAQRAGSAAAAAASRPVGGCRGRRGRARRVRCAPPGREGTHLGGRRAGGGRRRRGQGSGGAPFSSEQRRALRASPFPAGQPRDPSLHGPNGFAGAAGLLLLSGRARTQSGGWRARTDGHTKAGRGAAGPAERGRPGRAEGARLPGRAADPALLLRRSPLAVGGVGVGRATPCSPRPQRPEQAPEVRGSRREPRPRCRPRALAAFPCPAAHCLKGDGKRGAASAEGERGRRCRPPPPSAASRIPKAPPAARFAPGPSRGVPSPRPTERA